MCTEVHRLIVGDDDIVMHVKRFVQCTYLGTSEASREIRSEWPVSRQRIVNCDSWVIVIVMMRKC